MTHFFYKNTCLQINLSIDGDKGPIDIWHYDSIAYTGVVLLNKVEDMEGGELEIMNHEKNLALKLLEAMKHTTGCKISLFINTVKVPC